MLSYSLRSFGTALTPVTTDTPVPQGREVVLSIGSCGVCHSDVHLADGYFDIGGGGKVDLTKSVAPPRTLGHEIAGTVVAVGPEATGVAVGDRRVAFPWIGCGTCPMCVKGEEQLCAAPRNLGVNRDGGFADHVLVPDPKYLFDYAPLSEEQACTYACSGLTAFGALKKVMPLGPDEPLLIIGAGGVGLSAIRMAAKMGLPAPIVAEVDQGKWDMARAAGARETFDPKADGASRTLMKATGGVAAVIDFVGTGDSLAFGFGVVRKGATIATVGLIGGATPIAPALVAMKAVHIVGSYVGSLADMQELMALARTAGFPELPVTTLPLSSADATLDDLRHGRIRGRAVLKP